MISPYRDPPPPKSRLERQLDALTAEVERLERRVWELEAAPGWVLFLLFAGAFVVGAWLGGWAGAL